MEIETQSKGVPLYTLIFYVWCFLNVTFCHFSSLFCFGLTPTHIHTFIPPVLLTGFCSPLGYCPRCLLSWKPFCSFSAVPYPAVPLALLTFSVLHCGSQESCQLLQADTVLYDFICVFPRLVLCHSQCHAQSSMSFYLLIGWFGEPFMVSSFIIIFRMDCERSFSKKSMARFAPNQSLERGHRGSERVHVTSRWRADRPSQVSAPKNFFHQAQEYFAGKSLGVLSHVFHQVSPRDCSHLQIKSTVSDINSACKFIFWESDLTQSGDTIVRLGFRRCRQTVLCTCCVT